MKNEIGFVCIMLLLLTSLAVAQEGLEAQVTGKHSSVLIQEDQILELKIRNNGEEPRIVYDIEGGLRSNACRLALIDEDGNPVRPMGFFSMTPFDQTPRVKLMPGKAMVHRLSTLKAALNFAKPGKYTIEFSHPKATWPLQVLDPESLSGGKSVVISMEPLQEL